MFTKQFIVATTDLTRRLTAGWEPLACVAEELALLLDAAEHQLELAELDIPHWRTVIEDCLFEDPDHELLFDPALDGIEDDHNYLHQIGAAPMAFPDWFTPFNHDRPLPPYLLEPPSKPPRSAQA